MTLLTEARALVLACGLAAAVSVTAQTPVVKLEATPEYLRPDPFGGIVAPDKGDANNFAHALTLEGARGGYVSFHLVVWMLAPGPYTLAVRFEGNAGKLQADLVREWFHFTESDKQYYPDALITVA